MFGEIGIGKIASLFETVHPFHNFYIEPSIVDEGLEILLGDYFWGNKFNTDAHKFWR